MARLTIGMDDHGVGSQWWARTIVGQSYAERAARLEREGSMSVAQRQAIRRKEERAGTRYLISTPVGERIEDSPILGERAWINQDHSFSKDNPDAPSSRGWVLPTPPALTKEWTTPQTHAYQGIDDTHETYSGLTSQTLDSLAHMGQSYQRGSDGHFHIVSGTGGHSSSGSHFTTGQTGSVEMASGAAYLEQDKIEAPLKHAGGKELGKQGTRKHRVYRNTENALSLGGLEEAKVGTRVGGDRSLFKAKSGRNKPPMPVGHGGSQQSVHQSHPAYTIQHSQSGGQHYQYHPAQTGGSTLPENYNPAEYGGIGRDQMQGIIDGAVQQALGSTHASASGESAPWATPASHLPPRNPGAAYSEAHPIANEEFSDGGGRLPPRNPADPQGLLKPKLR